MIDHVDTCQHPDGSADYWGAKSAVSNLLIRVPCFASEHSARFSEEIVRRCSKALEDFHATKLLQNATFTGYLAPGAKNSRYGIHPRTLDTK